MLTLFVDIAYNRVSPKNQNVKFHGFHPLKHHDFAYNDTTKNFRVLPHVLLSELGAIFLLGEYKGEKGKNLNFQLLVSFVLKVCVSTP